MKYLVIPPTASDLGDLVIHDRMYQKYRQGPSAGGEEGGIIAGSNTNLGTRWWIKGIDFKNRYIIFPLNNREHTGERYFPVFRLKANFYKCDSNGAIR